MLEVYNASAGSGKTYNLALSYLRLLKQLSQSFSSLSLKNILAITFTNKAAFEMKERIIKFLKQIALKTPEGLILSSELEISPDLAERLLEKIFLDYDEFQVKTIDSFLLNLYRSIAYELNLLADFQIKDFLEDALIEKIFEGLFKKAEESPELLKFLENFLNHLLSTETKLKIDIRPRFFKFVRDLLKVLTYNERFLKAFEEQRERLTSDSSLDLYFTLYELIKKEIDSLFFKEKLLVIGVWKERLTTLLKDKEGFIPWIYVKLGSIDSIIIDEFQDTDKLQWEAMQPLVEELRARKGVLICAGDPKQSIFQWRGAAPELLEEVDRVFSGYERRKRVLDKNYRSFKEVVTFNNALFSTLKSSESLGKTILEAIVFEKNFKSKTGLSKEEVLEEGARRLKKTFETVIQEPVKEKGKGGRVEVRLLDIAEYQKTREQRKEFNRKLKDTVYSEIYEIIKTLKEEGALEDTAIIIRHNRDIEELTAFLLERGIKVIGSSSLKLKASPLLNNILAYLKLLHYKGDEPSLAAFLTSGFTEEGLKVFSAYEEACLSGKYVRLKEFVINEYPDFWKRHFSEFEKQTLNHSLYELVCEVVKRFDLEKNFSNEAPYLYEFLGVVLKHTLRFTSLGEFIEYWEKYFNEDLELPKLKDAVKVLTIHMAKGLEFNNVIFSLFWEERTRGFDLSLVFSEEGMFRGRKQDFESEGNLEALKAWYLQKMKEKLEIFNLVYVGLTRAVKRMYVLSPVPPLGKAFRFEGAHVFNSLLEAAKPDLSQGVALIERRIPH